ncbi:MAG: HAD family acid phosphatase [Pseudomonadota bacterium]
MNSKLSFVGLIFTVSLFTGCTTSDHAPDSIIHNNFNSTLWIQTASEYKANSIQAFNSAAAHLEQAKEDSSWTAMLEQEDDFSTLPAAVILDIDETVLDNSPYEAHGILEGSEFTEPSWDKWVAIKSAAAVPGAVEFINKAIALDIEVVYVTNRECMLREGSADTCPQEQDTIDNLAKVGIKNTAKTHIFLKSEKPAWTSEKESRRQEIAKQYRVIMLLGDDLGDFLPGVKNNTTPQERDLLVNQYQDHWGTKWFSLANPTYGSWRNVLEEPKSQYLRGY